MCISQERGFCRMEFGLKFVISKLSTYKRKSVKFVNVDMHILPLVTLLLEA